MQIFRIAFPINLGKTSIEEWCRNNYGDNLNGAAWKISWVMRHYEGMSEDPGDYIDEDYEIQVHLHSSLDAVLFKLRWG